MSCTRATSSPSSTPASRRSTSRSGTKERSTIWSLEPHTQGAGGHGHGPLARARRDAPSTPKRRSAACWRQVAGSAESVAAPDAWRSATGVRRAGSCTGIAAARLACGAACARRTLRHRPRRCAPAPGPTPRSPSTMSSGQPLRGHRTAARAAWRQSGQRLRRSGVPCAETVARGSRRAMRRNRCGDGALQARDPALLPRGGHPALRARRDGSPRATRPPGDRAAC